MEQSNNSGKTWAIIGGIVVIIAGILGYTSLGSNSNSSASSSGTSTDTGSQPTDTSTGTVESTSTGTTAATQASKYKDGTYSAEGTYVSPGGGDKVAVTLTIKNDVVTDSTFTPEPGDPESAQYQNRFASGYKQYVVGKNLDQISVSRVSGSSLTSRGFNDALAQIKAQAQA